MRRLGSELSVFTQLFKLTTIWGFEDKLAAAVKAAPPPQDHTDTNVEQQLTGAPIPGQVAHPGAAWH